MFSINNSCLRRNHEKNFEHLRKSVQIYYMISAKKTLAAKTHLSCNISPVRSLLSVQKKVHRRHWHQETVLQCAHYNSDSICVSRVGRMYRCPRKEVKVSAEKCCKVNLSRYKPDYWPSIQTKQKEEEEEEEEKRSRKWAYSNNCNTTIFTYRNLNKEYISDLPPPLL